MKRLIDFLGYLFSLFWSLKVRDIMHSSCIYFYTGYNRRFFKEFGRNSVLIPRYRMLEGAKYISIGKNCIIGSNVQLTAYDSYGTQQFTPSLVIGNGTEIGDGSHITCINKIEIGNNVLTGRYVLITDNAHGKASDSVKGVEPVKRNMYSKGPVIIKDNVWIGEKATITSGVEIGEGSIIGANTVVTKKIPPYSLVVGSPIRIIPLVDNAE